MILAVLREACDEWRGPLRGLAQRNSFDKTSQMLRAVCDTVSDFGDRTLDLPHQ